jgi:outer membrane protein assembly factor BamB
VVFVATEHDSVYALDADTNGAPLWQASLLDSAHGAAAGATPDPAYDTGCYVINGQEYGITGTPVIDQTTGTLYVVSLTFENSYSVQRLHALDIKSGAEKFGGPVTIAASMAGTGAGSSNGLLTFDPKWEYQRAGLALVNGNVYVAFAAHCDFNNYHGWLFAYDAATLAQTAVFLTSPNGVDSGIWMGAAAPAVDAQNGLNRMFITTGNGTYDAGAPYARLRMPSPQ